MRRQAEKLPFYPKVTKGKQVMNTPDMDIVPEDHFKVLKRIKDESKGDKSKEQLDTIAYMKKVHQYDTQQKAIAIEIERRDRRAYGWLRIKNWSIITMTLLLIIGLILMTFIALIQHD